MTADQRDRWAIPSLRPEVVDLSMLQPGTTIYAAANDAPRWAAVSVTYDIDEALLLEVAARRPDKDAAAVMLDLADQMSARGWRQEAAGTMRCNRRDGVECRGAWSTWRKVTP